jgi:hypothetical protein
MRAARKMGRGYQRATDQPSWIGALTKRIALLTVIRPRCNDQPTCSRGTSRAAISYVKLSGLSSAAQAQGKGARPRLCR